jgi:lipopolysaccharide/colanic/teichoic acid biosynthesis glycosyltransferase
MTTLAMGGIIGIFILLFHRIEVFRGILKIKNSYKHMLICFVLFGMIHGLIDNTLFGFMYFVPYMILLSEITIEKAIIIQEGESTMNDNNEIKIKNGLIYRFIKRLFDIISSGLFLILFSWLILILLFIKFCEDGHNPVYTSKRVGKNGKIIKFHKIRSMKPNADQLKQQLIDQGLNEADGPLFKMKNDPRITKFGKFLRKTSLDEILQIWDVFVGRISVVGPRSPEPKEFEQFSERAKHKVDVKGGLLCLWQIQHNRNQIPFDESIELDIKYMENRSLWLDFKIIVKGAWMVVFDHSGE